MRTRTGEDLKQLRKQAGLSQVQAARLSRTPKRTWQNWELDSDTLSSRRPAPIAFTFLEMYILLKSKGIEYEPEE